ncbi:immunity 49 family protein [Gelidibacter pelagius]|uniref:Immunity 49 family protein n=1 Tax=Gelidibacter pelagius TaxID=2819985 RepID=A0ABS3SUQ0_9FLAO|nr:immunity 49 family protein [Gelidibacter pelagius]MBO3099452.1 immunity 49 family protein [Gelidibacter pelagius]
MLKIDKIINEDFSFREIILNRINEDFNNLKSYSLELRFMEFTLAVRSIIDFDFNQAKQHFYTASLLDKLRIEKFNSSMLDYELSAAMYPILSDNEDLIKNYSKLSYNPWGKMPGMEENVMNGKDAIWCNTIQFFMANDIKGIERNLNIIEIKTLPKLTKNQQELEIDYLFYAALLCKDKSKCEELLEQLVSPKIHKKRNGNTVLAQYVSQPALGYAKLAWRLGVEVEVNSPLIPKEILPIEPLDNYEIPYDFLRN